MKNTKNLILMIFVSVCSFLLVGVMNVSAQIGFSNMEPVCTPDNVKPGETVTCYIRGKGNQAETGTSSTTPSAQETVAGQASPGQSSPLPAPTAEPAAGTQGAAQVDEKANAGKVHGFVTRLYTTDGLRFDSVQPYINGTNAVAYTATSASDANGKHTIELEKGTGEESESETGNKIEFTCTFDGTISAPSADWQIENGDDYRCALFYSKGKDAVVTVDAGAPSTDIQGLTGTGNGIMVVGKVLTHIDDSVDAGSSCGEFCVFTKEAATTSGYVLEGTDQYFCAEVHYTKDGTPASNVETGAFTSYFLLAAGALIAISAIAIAKKNNKFYRV